jgi:peroxiredoxin
MHPDLEVGSQFPDFELLDQDDQMQQLSKLIRG